MSISTGNGLSSRERNLKFNGTKQSENKRRNMDPFFGLDIEVLQEIENRCKAELEDKDLPYHRKEEIESCLYHIKEAKIVKRGFYIDRKLTI